MRFLHGLATLLRRRPAPARASATLEVPADEVAAAAGKDPPTETAPLRIARLIFDEATASRNRWQTDLRSSARWNRLKEDPPGLQIAVLVAAVEHGGALRHDKWRIGQLQRAMATQVVRRSLPFTEADLLALLKAWLQQPDSLEYGLPGATLLGAVERYARGAELSPALIRVLERLRARALGAGLFTGAPTKATVALAHRIAGLLQPTSSEAVELPSGAFAKRFGELMSSLPESDRSRWQALAGLAVAAGDRSSPSRKWLEAAASDIRDLVPEQVTAVISRSLEDTTPDPARPDPSLDILKGLIWASTLAEGGGLAGAVGRFAERCFRKVPNLGARSVKLGNAALWALSEMAGASPPTFAPTIAPKLRLAGSG